MESASRTPTTKPSSADLTFKQALVPDLISGFIIFLIALPLSIGIALASGAPPTAGILAAIVGGVLGSYLGGSYLTINGPAAGLIVIVIGAIQDLGKGDATLGYRRMLASVLIAGALQIVFAVLRLGILGSGVPSSVIHGMLTAIGFIIMVKQFPVALGVAPHGKDVIGILGEAPDLIRHLNPEVALIAALGFIVILTYNQLKGKWLQYLPAPLVVVVLGILMGHFFDFDHEHLVTSHWQQFQVGPKLLLNLPEHLASAIVFPDFSAVFSWDSIRYAITFALVASIESLLSSSAVDRMDPYGRTSSLDRELLSKGICNMVSSAIGGLPIIAEMVRSSANVRNGARTPAANFFHGIFILAFLILFPWLLHQIPLAALAAVLISVGYRLAHPSQFLHTAEIGRDHFAAFLTTFLVTIGSDLLLGVAAGIGVELAFNLLRGASPRDLFRVRAEEERRPNQVTLRVQSPVVFTNLISLKRRLESISREEQDELVVDLSATTLVDHTSLDALTRYRVAFSESHRPVSAHPLAARRLRKVR